ncbi:MAG TPA: 16S rRNA (uracil(1498)-N(3))-methyltransferase [Ktedonobacteraceae bacterium]|nr:16S rRNA (uracil(1498)-N(3))-methyltransferase [Ktedonobacteraceae bacterium]
MHRFFLAPSAATLQVGHTLRLPNKIAHQVRTVLHIAINEELVLLDNSGDELLCVVVQSGKAGVEVEIRERRAGQRESPVQVMLCQGLLKSARFEWLLEKGTELGVTTFAPMQCRRSTAGLEHAGLSKIQRWQHIVQEAAEQCGRARLPALMPICSLEQMLKDLPTGTLALMPWEEEHALSLHAALRTYIDKVASTKSARELLTVALFIGPEGGLTAEEAQLAQRYGVQVVSLGARILRAETAALASVANVMYELEGYLLK